MTYQLKSELKYCNYKQLCKPALKIKAADFDLLCSTPASSCRDFCITSKFLKLTWYHFIRTIDMRKEVKETTPALQIFEKQLLVQLVSLFDAILHCFLFVYDTISLK